jgi:hypothetical protein
LFGAIVTPLHDIRHAGGGGAGTYELVKGTTNVFPTLGSLSWVNKDALTHAVINWEETMQRLTAGRRDTMTGSDVRTQQESLQSWPTRVNDILRPALVLLVGGKNSRMQEVATIFDEMARQVKLAESEFKR